MAEKETEDRGRWSLCGQFGKVIARGGNLNKDGRNKETKKMT